jgi:DNA-binding beta-propeller fold protein YncE
MTLAGCSAEQGTSGRDTTGSERDAQEQATSERAYTPPKNPLPAPKPAKALPLEEEPAGLVFEVGPGPEGIVADPETGLVAVGLRNPDVLALVDGGSGEVIRKARLPGPARHLNIVAPGGPVLAPGEPSDSLSQISLPDGEVVEEKPVDNFPHNAAAAPGGRIFVINEAASTANVIEEGKVIKTIKTPPGPGGVAVTEDGLVGIVGVRGLALEVFEADTLDSLGIIDAGEGPTHVKAGPDDRFYVADTRGGAVLVYEASPELRQIDRVMLPESSPYGLAVDPERGHLWVTLTAENRLVQYALEDAGLREISSFPTVRQPNSVTVDPASGRVFVAGREEGVLQILELAE